MAPTSWAAAFLFVVLVAPGLLFDLLSEKRRVLPSESAFREISRVVLSSIVFTGFSLLLLVGVRTWWAPPWLPDPGLAIRDPSHYFPAHYQLVGCCIAGVVAVAFGLALGADRYLAMKSKSGGIKKRSAWTIAFENDCPVDRLPYARIRLDDGSVYAGHVRAFSPDIETSDREIILKGPHLKSKTGENKLAPVAKDYERIVLKGADVKAISVSYWPKNAPPEVKDLDAAGEPAAES
jgi:hypothetical protein